MGALLTKNVGYNDTLNQMIGAILKIKYAKKTLNAQIYSVQTVRK